MADHSKIEWTDATWNPVTGCTKVSAGCKHCYAERQWKRLSAPGMPYAGRAFTDVALHPERLDQPLRWRKPRRIFVNSMSDLFHPDVPDDYIDRVFAVMALAPQHTFQVLTKRPRRMRDLMIRAKYTSPGWAEAACGIEIPGIDKQSEAWLDRIRALPSWPLPNVWLGASIEDQLTADERTVRLLQTPAAVRWLSVEPMLGSVNLPRVDFHCDLCGGTGMLARWPKGRCHHCNGRGFIPGISTDPKFGTPATPMRFINWVVCGGESGPKARPMHPDWVRSLRDQCVAAGVPFLLKQVGEWGWASHVTEPAAISHAVCLHGIMAEFTQEAMRAACPECTRWEGLRKCGKRRAGRLLDGALWDEYPEPTP
jgi:protein gp37